MAYIVVSKVRELCKKNGRRLSKEFLHSLDAHVEDKVNKACQVHNGGKQTLDCVVAAHVGITA